MTIAAERGAVPRPWWETRWCVALALMLTALPLLWPALPPLTDLPGALARYRVMFGADPGSSARGLVGWKPIGDPGVDLLVAALAPLLGLEPAVKAIVVAVPVIAAAGMLWLSRVAHGRVQPGAYVALPFAYHPAFLAGFVDAALAMALALNALALWLRLARRPRLRAGLFMPLAVAIRAMHPLGWLCLGVMVFAAELARARAVETNGARRGWIASGWRAGVACLPLAPAVLMPPVWPLARADVGGDWLAALALKPGLLAGALRDRWWAFDIGAILIVAMVLYRGARDRRFAHAPLLDAAALGLVALFVAMPIGPGDAGGPIAPYAIVVALLAIRFNPRVTRRRRAEVAWAALAFLVARTAASTASFALESRDWNRHLAALDHIPRGARVAAFVGAGCDQPWRLVRAAQLPDMAIVRRAASGDDPSDPDVTAPGIAGVATARSRIVTDTPCAADPSVRTVDQALARLPRDRADMLWLITPGPIDPARLGDARLVWSDGRDVLFALPQTRTHR